MRIGGHVGERKAPESANRRTPIGDADHGRGASWPGAAGRPGRQRRDDGRVVPRSVAAPADTARRPVGPAQRPTGRLVGHRPGEFGRPPGGAWRPARLRAGLPLGWQSRQVGDGRDLAGVRRDAGGASWYDFNDDGITNTADAVTVRANLGRCLAPRGTPSGRAAKLK
jgi:hypothetical protein